MQKKIAKLINKFLDTKWYRWNTLLGFLVGLSTIPFDDKTEYRILAVFASLELMLILFLIYFNNYYFKNRLYLEP